MCGWNLCNIFEMVGVFESNDTFFRLHVFPSNVGLETFSSVPRLVGFRLHMPQILTEGDSSLWGVALSYILPQIDMLKATHWSTNGDITDAHISATIQQILTKFSAVVSYVKQRQIGKFQLICTWVTMLSKYIILQYGLKSRSKNKINFA